MVELIILLESTLWKYIQVLSNINGINYELKISGELIKVAPYIK